MIVLTIMCSLNLCYQNIFVLLKLGTILAHALHTQWNHKFTLAFDIIKSIPTLFMVIVLVKTFEMYHLIGTRIKQAL